MKVQAHILKKDESRKAVACVSLALMLAAVIAPAVLAQGLANPEEDSLLPPEVVPLDPQAASAMSAAQAAKRQVQSAGGDPSVPGLTTQSQPNMVPAKDMRDRAFNALYGQGQVLQNPWQTAQGTPNAQPGSPNMQRGNPNAPPYMTGYEPNMLANAQPAQTQTLSGGVKNQPKLHDIRRGGFTNTASALAAFGTGAVMGGALYHQSNPLMGLGIFGLTMTGFGVRNAFRF